ncbi:hypothetical protein [Streptomyces tsukubensis]|uniref:hypothetical protein n=1 Tax=Streptomyces tsukubensis TaxID=83656 RepID=UPI00344EA2A3
MPNTSPLDHHGPLVPYITAWTSEHMAQPLVITKGAGIGYADETPYDRDRDGVLWIREPSSPGRGKPVFGRVHPMRQRRALRRLLCQVCGHPADRNEQGILWLLGGTDNEDLTTTHPPICAPCAALAVRTCPSLRRQHALVRARSCLPFGVHGALHRPGIPHPLPDTGGGLAYGDPRIRWMRAAQLIVRLEGATEVSPSP